MSDNSESCAHIVPKPSESPSIQGNSAQYDRTNQGYIFATTYQKGIALSERSQTHKNHPLCYSLVWFFFFLPWDWWIKRARNLISNFQVMNMNTWVHWYFAVTPEEQATTRKMMKMVLSNFGGGYPKIYIWQNSLNSIPKKGDFRYMCAHSRPAFCNPMDCSSPGSSVPRILQARILE